MKKKFDEESIIKGIDKFQSVIIEPYKQGNNPDDYIKYFREIYSNCIPDGILGYIMFFFKNNNFPFYRIRAFTEIKDRYNIQEYSYPPAGLCKDFNRANLPGHPVFYASLNAGTAIAEFQKKYPSVKKIALSKWVKRNEIDTLNILPVYPDNKDFRDVLMASLDSGNFPNKNIKMAFFRLMAYIGNSIMSEKDYSISACFSNEYFTKVNDLDIIAYPSIIDMKGTNFAVSPSTIDNKLILDRTYIINLRLDTSITLEAIGVLHKSKIYWKQKGEINTDSDFYKTFITDISDALTHKNNLSGTNKNTDLCTSLLTRNDLFSEFIFKRYFFN